MANNQTWITYYSQISRKTGVVPRELRPVNCRKIFSIAHRFLKMKYYKIFCNHVIYIYTYLHTHIHISIHIHIFVFRLTAQQLHACRMVILKCTSPNMETGFSSRQSARIIWRLLVMRGTTPVKIKSRPLCADLKRNIHPSGSQLLPAW